MDSQLPTDSDKRRAVRYETHLSALVTNSWQEQSQALVTNISREGVKLEGNRELVDKIFPNFNPDRTGEPHLIVLQMALEEGAALTEDNSIKLECGSVYVMRERRDWFQVGLCYRGIESQIEPRLEAFIHQLEGSQQAQP